MRRFYLGAHHADWLGRAGVPLFVSRATLARLRKLPRASAPWALDSGGFTELLLHGGWRGGARAYAADARRFRDEVGLLDFAAPQDWMCEPAMLQRTGLTVEKHQELTTTNYLELMTIAPDVPWIPVLQGWTMGDYLRHAETYEAAGVELAALTLVGVGSVCRRQATLRTSALFTWLRSDGLRLHGFGLKLSGLRAGALELATADSMAWSYNARRNPPMPGHQHKSCANCLEYALEWRAEAVAMQEAT
jgi:hypothetical protein